MSESFSSRRQFLQQSAMTATTILGFPSLAPARSERAAEESPRAVPLIHQTDLFRPHVDPDDHFDLASVYGLAQRGAVELLGVLCDSPPAGHNGDPDVAAVAMLNHLTGLAAPLVVGMPHRPASRHDKLASASVSDLGGVHWLLKTLQAAPEPVVITVVGSCRDVAVASRLGPEVFARKCRAIYLNAGTGCPDPQPTDHLEYNVGLDPGSYASMFDVPCPLYWMPCFQRLGPNEPNPNRVMPHGTYYQFRMEEVLAHLSAPVRRFFLSMLDAEPATDWLRSLRRPVNPEKLASWGKQMRNMWCTAGFCHLAGLTVASDGSLEREERTAAEAPYRFLPIEVECTDQGRTAWRPARSKPARFKFEVTQPALYQQAMTRALRDLIRPVSGQP